MLQTASRKCIKPKYLPKGVTLQQYYHMCLNEVEALLKHWTKRQDDGKVPFCFRKDFKGDLQDEHTAEPVDPGADMAPGEEVENHPQDGDGSQAQGDGASREDSGSNAAENPSRVGRLLRCAICRP